MFLVFIAIILLILYCGLMGYYRLGWVQMPLESIDSPKRAPQTTISVIIPARNEAENIVSCIDSILLQQYPDHLFEIIVIDDHSTDATAESVLLSGNKKVRLIRLADEMNGIIINSYKKKAIETGIKYASGKLIVTTDADCLAPPGWLSAIAVHYEKYNDFFIAAPVAFYDENNLMKIFQSIDFLTMQGITGSAVYKKIQCMCNGANLAYEKEIFYKVGGFSGIDNIASGDDMLLMHKIYQAYPEKVSYLKNTNAIVKTKPVDSFSAFLNQRIRWASKAGKYEDKKITGVLMVVYFFNLSLLMLTVYSIFDSRYLVFCLLTWLLKIVAELLLIMPVATFFNKRKMLWWFVPLQPLHVLYILISGWLGKFGKYSWKERTVK